MPLSNDHLSVCKALLDQLERTGPEHFNLDRWYQFRLTSTGAVHEWSLGNGLDTAFNFHDCGTTACIAGHTLVALDADQVTDLVDELDSMDTDHGFVRDERLRNLVRDERLRNLLAVRLGMDVGRDPAYFDLTDWFFGTWPRWAGEQLDDRYLRYCSAGEVRSTARHHAEYDVVLQAVDQIVHGVRLNWWAPIDAEPTEHAIEYVDEQW